MLQPVSHIVNNLQNPNFSIFLNQNAEYRAAKIEIGLQYYQRPYYINSSSEASNTEFRTDYILVKRNDTGTRTAVNESIATLQKTPTKALAYLHKIELSIFEFSFLLQRERVVRSSNGSFLWRNSGFFLFGTDLRRTRCKQRQIFLSGTQ